MKKMPISILCGLAAVLVTVILYFTILGNIFAEIICLITLLGVLLAEAVVVLLAYLSKGCPRKVAATFAASLMIPVSIGLSFIYIVKFPFGYASYLGYYFVVFAILMTIAGILWGFSGRAEDKNAELQNAKQNMLNLRKLVKSIMLEPGAEKYKKELNDIEEKLHFSNDSVITDADREISAVLNELRAGINNEEFDVVSCIQKIEKKIDLRNIAAKKTV